MSILDEVTISIAGGHGGPGHCSFLRTMQTRFGGPDGGNGGRGGNVYLIGNQNINTLHKFKWKKIFQAENGERGKNKSKHGSDGDDLVIYVPCGTQIFNDQQELIIDITEHNQKYLIAKGGKKGMGNEFFKTSINRAPTRTTIGLPGEEIEITLSLKMLADVGIIGMPNAGKSSFIRNSTNSKAKIGNYQFTTLTPNLGVCYQEDKSITLADLPGVIEHASEGKGLGIQFLKHIERCKILLHFVDVSNIDYKNNLNIIISEMYKFNREMLNKTIITCFTKIDTVEEYNEVKKEYPNAFFISNFDTPSYKALLDKVFSYFEPRHKAPLPEINLKNSKTF